MTEHRQHAAHRLNIAHTKLTHATRHRHNSAVAVASARLRPTPPLRSSAWRIRVPKASPSTPPRLTSAACSIQNSLAGQHSYSEPKRPLITLPRNTASE